MKNKVMILFLLLGVVSACGGSGGGSDDPPTPTKTELLTQTWQLQLVEVNGLSSSTSGFSFRFNAGGTFNFQTPPNDDLQLPSSGTWAFNSSETEVVLDGGAFRLTVISLTENSMVLEFRYENYKSGQVTYRFSFG